MESWPEKKPHRNRFDGQFLRRGASNRLEEGLLALPAAEGAGRKKPAGKPNGRLLQVGCRAGNFLMKVKDQFGAVFGTDTDLGVLREAARRKLPVALSKGGRLPYGEGSFDFLLAFDAEEPLKSPTRFLAETSRVLKKRGEMILTFRSPLPPVGSANPGGQTPENSRDLPTQIEAAGLELFLFGTDALWDSPSFPPLPSFLQTVFFAGIFDLFFRIEPFFPWQFGGNQVLWLKKK